VEATTGEVYRGKLIEAEDNMISHSLTVTFRDGRVAPLENKTFIPGALRLDS